MSQQASAAGSNAQLLLERRSRAECNKGASLTQPSPGRTRKLRSLRALPALLDLSFLSSYRSRRFVPRTFQSSSVITEMSFNAEIRLASCVRCKTKALDNLLRGLY